MRDIYNKTQNHETEQMLRSQYSQETVLDEDSSSENSEEEAVFDREVQARNVSEGNAHYDENKQNESR